MKKHPGQADYGSNFTMCLGVVKNNADPGQHGRLQIYIPSIDTRDYELEDLPWANYVAPFGGTTANFKVGREANSVPGASTYGFWAIPKIGGQVLCGFLEGEPQVRFWMGAIYMPELNRTLPQSINGGLTEIDESGIYPQAVIPFQQANLTDAGLQPNTIHYKTRGGYERSVSHPSNKNRNKPTNNGYAPMVLDPTKADSQAICLTSPGRHYVVMSDVDEYCRIRIKTTEGSQVIFDDTNERIYVSTAKGRNWIELDETSGKIYIFSDSKVTVRAKNDINLYSDENVNIVANKRVNIRSEERAVVIEAKHDVRLLSTDADVMLTASRDVQLKTTDGPQAAPISEEQICNPSPLHGSPGKGWIYRWGEKGGSSTSKIRLNSLDTIEIRSDAGGVNISGMTEVNAKAFSGNVNIQAGGTLNYMGSDLQHTIASSGTGLVADDPDDGEIPVLPTGGAGPALAAESAQSVQAEPIVDHMILPDHEPWVRDEDESKCKTPRNPKYQG